MTEVNQGRSDADATEQVEGDGPGWKRKGDSWDRWGRKVILRFSVKRPEELRVMDEYDRRSALRGRPDKEFLKSCVLAGFAVLTRSDALAEVVGLAGGNGEAAAEAGAPQAGVGRSANDASTADLERESKSEGSSGVAAKSLLGDLMKVEVDSN